MKKAICAMFAMVMVSAMVMWGCAGKTGNAVTGQPAVPPATPAAKAPAPVQSQLVATLSVQGELPPDTLMGGVDITLNLPRGVTASADGIGMTRPGVAAPTGSAKGAMSVARYIPATAEKPAQVRFAAIKVAGFGTGEVAILKLDLNGTPPTDADFPVAALLVTDPKGKTLNGLKVSVSIK